MHYYVTLFDSNYLTRGLVMYSSLLRHAGEFHLWIICFEDLAYQLNLRMVNLATINTLTIGQNVLLNFMSLPHLRARLAPWNAAQYELTKNNKDIFVEEYPLFCYSVSG